VGATYDEQDLSEMPTPQRRQELIDALNESLCDSHEIQVLKHLAGVRPSSTDSRPILGGHPAETGLYILNGLGSKGASTAPAMTQQLTEHILAGTPISPEVALTRFDSMPCV
jgi:glycine/D-amino acid oxidase-like deaminating enzyme